MADKMVPKLVVIEKNGPDSMIPMLQSITAACRALGYRTMYWERAGRQHIHDSSVVFLWGWNMVPSFLARIKPNRGKRVYIEKGWFADRDYCLQMGLKGTNSHSDWADEPLEYTPAAPMEIRPSGTLMVCLRYEHGGRSIDNPSPYFENNMAWLEHFARIPIPFPVEVRPHFATPKMDNDITMPFVLAQGWRWVNGSEQVGPLLPDVKAVAVVDSTVGSKALELGMPVLCYGNPVYRKEHVVYCMDSSDDKARRILRQLGEGLCPLDMGAVRAMVAKMKAKEWHVEDAATFAERFQKEFGL
jgi:hypothetical protein